MVKILKHTLVKKRVRYVCAQDCQGLHLYDFVALLLLICGDCFNKEADDLVPHVFDLKDRIWWVNDQEVLHDLRNAHQHALLDERSAELFGNHSERLANSFTHALNVEEDWNENDELLVQHLLQVWPFLE